MSLPEVVERAAVGSLPEWAEASGVRRAHMARVSALLSEWAEVWRLAPEERVRWISVGYLHDSLRDADPASLRALVPEELADVPDGVVHGPAAAARLRDDGVDDEELLAAVSYHPLGHPGFRRLGRALYVADFLDPGRDFLNEWRADLRARVPLELDGVTLEVAAARIQHLLERRLPLRSETAGFWNALVPGL